MGQKVMSLSDPVPKVMPLHVILKPSCVDTRFCPSLCCVAEPVVCPCGGLPVHRRDGKGGVGRHQRAPSARGGAGRPEWEGEGRMAYMWTTTRLTPKCPRKRSPLLRGARSCRDGEAHRAQGVRAWVRK